MKAILRQLLPRYEKRHMILSGSLKGMQIVTSWHNFPAAILGYTEGPLLAWFAQNVRLGETWLDVGAHYGYTAIALSNLIGASGRVFAFEPMLSTVGYLNQTRQANHFRQITIIPFALGDKTRLSTIQLPVTRGMVDSTLAHADWEETILVAGLDWLWPQICGSVPQIDGIKIDVQGMEIQVLRGMAETLRQQHPRLVLEVHRGVSRFELLDLLESAGYSRRATPIEPVEGEIEPRYVDDRSYAFHTL